MPITIVSCYNQTFDYLNQVVRPNKQQYCQKHSYKLLDIRKETPPGTDDIKGLDAILWAKPWAILEALKENDLVCWMDADMIVTDMEVKMEPFFTHDLVFTGDINGLNAGIIFIRKCEWSINFINKWWESGKRFCHHISSEQTALAHLMPCEPQEHWQCIPQKRCNGFLYEWHDNPYPEGQWEKGDFILHLPAMKNSLRRQIFTRVLAGHADPSSELMAFYNRKRAW
jgi:hypothetical protein